MRHFRAALPNSLSLSRVPLGIAFLLAYDDTTYSYTASLLIVSLALATDILDGHLARRWHVETEIGYFLDGLGDKAVYIAILLVMSREHASSTLLIWLLIAREVFLYALRSIDDKRAEHLASHRNLSLGYALFIRLYFGCFFVADGLGVFGGTPPAILEYGDIFGYVAAVLGYTSIARLAKDIAQEV